MNHLARLATLPLLMTIMTGCTEQPPQHAAEGRWRGDMVSQGVVIDIGWVLIGSDYVSLLDSNRHYRGLNANRDSNSIRYSDSNNPAFNARIRLIGQDSASLQISDINGYIDLSKEAP